MNNARRKQLTDVIKTLEEMKIDFEILTKEEEFRRNNIPADEPGNSNRRRAEETCISLYYVLNHLSEAVANINSAVVWGSERKRDKAYCSDRIPFTPKERNFYTNVNGERYKCLCIGAEKNCAIMQNVITKWTIGANGIGIYPDGRIDWDYSSNGYFDLE